MFFTPIEFLRNPSRALQLRIRCCEAVRNIKLSSDPACVVAQRNQARAAWWLAILARLTPDYQWEVTALVVARWSQTPRYLTLREIRDAVECTIEDPCDYCAGEDQP